RKFPLTRYIPAMELLCPKEHCNPSNGPTSDLHSHKNSLPVFMIPKSEYSLCGRSCWHACRKAELKLATSNSASKRCNSGVKPSELFHSDVKVTVTNCVQAPVSSKFFRWYWRVDGSRHTLRVWH